MDSDRARQLLTLERERIEQALITLDRSPSHTDPLLRYPDDSIST
jgi:hypothetical protein